MRKFVHAAGLVFIFFAGNALADGGVAGQIKDSNGRPVSNARVSIGNKSDFTDNEGQYRIKGLSTGKYRIQINKGTRRVVDSVEIEDTVIRKDLLLR